MSAGRYEIFDDGPCIRIVSPDSTISTIVGRPVGYHIDDAVIGAIRQQARDIAALKDALADEVTANEAFRKAGGARDDEDMPTFCARLIAERDAYKHDALALMKISAGAIQALEQTEKERDQLRADLAAAVAERDEARTAYQVRNTEWHQHELIALALAERYKLRAEQAEARIAAIEAAPVVALVEGGEGFRYLSWGQLPPVGIELIARPAKD